MTAPDPRRVAQKNKARADELAETNVPAPADRAETEAASAEGDLAETTVPEQNGADDPQATLVRPNTEASEQPAAGAAVTKKASSSKAPSSGSGKRRVTQLGDFKIEKKLGQGGMGTVYLATQVSLDRKVALKTLSKEFAKKEDFVKRFIREARAMAKILHPNVVQVYAADSVRGVHFAAIEFIDGQSMQDWMDELGQLSVGDAVLVSLVCADALRHAHELNMIHRDVKPDNILVTKKGEIKVADFGLAKALDEDVSVTQSGTGLGTPLYMSPEQARNAKHVDLRSDIYALGCTLYYFLTGRLPFKGETTLELITAKEKGKFTSARRLNPDVPEQLDLMIDKMVAKDPAHRYADCSQLIRDMQGLQLDNPSLSFIDAGDRVAVPRPAGGVRAASAASPAKRSTTALSSAEDAARTEARASKRDTVQMWFVQHTNERGKTMLGKMTTAQIAHGVKAGTIDLKAKAKKSAKDVFLPLAQFPEFRSVMERQAIRAKAEARSGGMKEMFERLDRQERRRKRWRWLRNLIDDVKDLISLIIWLAFLAAAGYGIYKYAIPWLQEMMKSGPG